MTVGDLKAQRMDQVEPRAGQGAEASNIPRILRNLGIEQDEMQHAHSVVDGQKSREPSVSRFTANRLQRTFEPAR
jgi:hypothetical protein